MESHEGIQAKAEHQTRVSGARRKLLGCKITPSAQRTASFIVPCKAADGAGLASLEIEI